MEIGPSRYQSRDLPIVEASQVGDARRHAARLTLEAGLAENERAAVALIITEIGNNLVKYGKSGRLVLRILAEIDVPGFEVLSLDQGPGIPDIAKSLADGYSTGGTTGNGLGAVQRMSDLFEIYSSPQCGTAILSRVYSASKRPADGNVDIGAICVPIAGEQRCGDSWGILEGDGRACLMLVDGLGHGAIAAEAADEAVRVFHDYAHSDRPAEIVSTAHTALRSTRGAVMAVADARLDDGSVTYAGVGNIAGSIAHDSGVQHMVSVNGTVGLVAKPKEFSYRWPPGGILILTSDGIQTRWQLDRFPGLLRKHPAIIAGMIYQYYARVRDDATVVALRLSKSQPA